MKEATYKKEMLEGGEGFNPFTKTELATFDRGERMYRIQNLLNGMSFNDDRYPALEAQLAELKAEEEADFAAEWTKEVTTSRRAAWNAWLADAKAKGRAISQEELSKKQAEVGFTMSDLKKAIALNSL